MTGARRSSAQISRLNSVISRIGEVATTEAVRTPPIATSGGADQSGGEISTAISPTTSPAPIVPTVSPLMMTSAVPLSMAYSEYPTRPSSASNCPGGISASDAMLATAASSFSGRSAKKRIAASRNVSIFPDYTAGPTYATSLQGRFSGRRQEDRHDLEQPGDRVDPGQNVQRVVRGQFTVPVDHNDDEPVPEHHQEDSQRAPHVDAAFATIRRRTARSRTV